MFWDIVRFLTEVSTLEIMAWSTLSEYYDTGRPQYLSKRNLYKINKVKVLVTTHEQAGNLIELVSRLMPRVI